MQYYTEMSVMNEKQTILIIEDERTISNFISRALSANDSLDRKSVV